MRWLALVGWLGAVGAWAGSPPMAPDFSGTYDCTGKDQHEGPYTGTVTLTRQAAHSEGEFAAYEFTLDVPGYGLYVGHAAARGRTMAIYFALTDPATRDFGTGLATFTANKSGRWRFHKFYYEPEFKGGNHGFEDCTRR
ncbi:MAG: hypothetical protein JNJ44_00565 [Zoogloeaceae bacterium]|nr:hypothetical protein [Zoogloeaceae bacterium]